MTSPFAAGTRPGNEVGLAVGAGLLGCGYAAYRIWTGVAGEPGLELSAQVIGAVALLWRTRFPVPVALLTIGLSFLSPVVAVVLAMHAVGRYETHRRIAAAVVVLGALAAALAWWSSLFSRGSVLLLVELLVAVLVPWLIGGHRRAELEIEEAVVEARLAAAEESAREVERARLVREMHDVVAHRLSLLVMGTQVLRTRTQDPQVQAGLQDLSGQGRAALDEMRDVLRLTRSADLTDRRADLGDIDGLARDARAVGQPVTVDVTAVPVPDGPDMAELTAARIVREALTNAVRHAPGAPTTVRIAEDGPAGLVVDVRNARPSRPPTGLGTGGHGLRGMRERVALLGGQITADPTDDGGFAVHARLPRRMS